MSKVKKFFGAIGHGIAKVFTTIYSNKKSAAGFTIILIFLFFATFGPMIFPYDPSTNYAEKYQGASVAHILGTDYMGRDVFRQLVSGCRSMVFMAILTGVMTVVIGTFLGILSGYAGGVVDKIIQTITNLVLNIPQFPILLVLSAVFTIQDIFSFALVLSVFGWAGLCRAVRAQVISLKERDFIQICKVMKMSKLRVIFTEITPNIYSYIVVNFVIVMRNSIISSVGIMTLGLAAFDSTNWGVMLYQSRILGLSNADVILYMLKPLVAMMLLQMGTIFLANGLDEVLNPRLKRL